MDQPWDWSKEELQTLNRLLKLTSSPPPPPPPSLPSSSKLSPYQLLLLAGPRVKPLKQVHAHFIISGIHLTRSLSTKLAALACTSKSTSYTRCIFSTIHNPDSFLLNTLIRLSSQVGFHYYAIMYYNFMLRSNVGLSNYTFSSIIKACGAVSGLKFGRCVHSHAIVNGYGLDCYVQSSLVGFYAKCGELVHARKVFDKMPERTVVAWNTMIAGYEQNGLANDAIEVFYSMWGSGISPDLVTFVSVLSACAQLGGIELGVWVHECIGKHGLEVNVTVGTALINMYVKCGSLRKAREVFDRMKDKNVVAWTSMISGYGVHGYGKEVLKLYRLMKFYGVVPNEITFLSLLSAYGHAGMVDEGREVFSSMTRDYGLIPGIEHHVAMVDLLGRAGLLEEAFDYASNVRKPSAAIWTALLGACKMHKNLNLGVQAAEKLLAIDSENPGHYVMLSNVYALAGKMNRVEKIRNVMIRKGLKKPVGYSTIEVNRKTHLFSMGDKSHAEWREIYTYLDDLMRRISEAGYVPAQESVLHKLEEEEREYALRYHSEKLALAYGLLKVKSGLAIRIVKNLRICEDCHLAIKFISSVTSREIIIRDKLRFHHFKDGLCSCKDYW